MGLLATEIILLMIYSLTNQADICIDGSKHCQTCQDSKICKVCDDGYQLFVDKDVRTCILLDPLCSKYDGSLCTACLDGAYITQHMTCDSCINSCKKCSGTPFDCTTCFDEYQLITSGSESYCQYKHMFSLYLIVLGSNLALFAIVFLVCICVFEKKVIKSNSESLSDSSDYYKSILDEDNDLKNDIYIPTLEQIGSNQDQIISDVRGEGHEIRMESTDSVTHNLFTHNLGHEEDNEDYINPLIADS